MLPPERMVVACNGVYDLLCAASILFLSDASFLGILAKLHPNMFVDDRDRDNPVVRRLLAYWLATYGCVRVAACARDRRTDILAIATYFIEACAYANEYIIYRTAAGDKAAFVSLSSLVIGCIAIRTFNKSCRS